MATPQPASTQRDARIDALLSRAPVLPVLRIDRIEDAVPLARTLVDAGLSVLEVTLRSDIALEAIRRIVDSVPGACVGAGTVLDATQLAAVARAGAAFAISPGATDALYDAATTAALPWIPAVATASDVMRGIDRGYRRFKFFPAEAAGGVVALRAFAGPFADVLFCPTGGIDADNAPGYLRLSNVITVGGSWMAPADAIAAGDWTRIGAMARACLALSR
ncbi:bifunctional 4-hydroxy-2-oxoglutarate aldolase/2-dehydro-3-deoxy-phosphogluconate aldolase [Cognatiluteimonas profundi]|uniref:bifunctional 4-hydroxy-2-oxoglutarate aldolase/2-dehydro-3-deoxy-phosphogluconate aldolase n=1 Tax=Cognatiluteimonas profundi TaxID=2594501 RepID=UPI00131C02AA|nr:bifunctional 4-hydroxy-2-oxoglutarate aldolase/2-dehydro-3-deoxy-phosphogluconate aldolase [Lysobacter profundi]